MPEMRTDAAFEKAVAIIGNLSDGFRVVGPFDCHDDASDWCMEHESEFFGSWIVTLLEPWKEVQP